MLPVSFTFRFWTNSSKNFHFGVSVEPSGNICHMEKTIHANLPPQTGLQLGQSGGESSGVERAQRSLDPALIAARWFTAWEQWRLPGSALMVKLWPHQRRQHTLTWHDARARAHVLVQTHKHTRKKTYCVLVAKVPEISRVTVLHHDLNMSPRLLTLWASQTTHKPKQISKLLPLNSAQTNWETTFAPKQCM